MSAFARYETKVINDRIVEGVAAMRERQALLGQQLQQRGQARILKMNEQEIDQLHPVDAAALLRAGAELERKARKVEDGESVGGWDMPKPTFTIQIINLPPLETHARVQLDGQPGVVARDQLDRFKADFPEAVILC